MSSSVKSNFERKKRDLSNNSNNEDEREKARESSLDLSLSTEINDDVHVVQIFVQLFKKSGVKKVNEIYELSSSTKDAQIKGARQL